jgi:ATP-binding cassette subfamily B protein
VIDEIQLQLQTQAGDAQKLFGLIAIGFLVSLAGIVFTALTERLGDHFAGKIRKFLTEKFYDKVLSLPQSYFDSEISGKIINQLNRGIATIQDFINTSTNFILPTFLQSILTVGILAYFDLAIAGFILLLFPVYLTISYYSAKRWGVKEVVKNQIEDATRGRLAEVVTNIKLVKSFTNERNEFKLVADNLAQINSIYAKQSQEFHILDFIRNLSLSIILVIVNVIVFYKTFQGEFSFGDLILIIQLIDQARRPLFAMSFILEQVQRAESGSKEFFDVLTLESTEDYSKLEEIKLITNPEIELKDVQFKYETSDQVLDKINFRIGNNETVALVGPSGAGKSTIINLILKFYNPTDGSILLNGKDYSGLSHRFIRENISLVFQENELFSSTIRENVAYGQIATEAEVIAALQKANAWSFVQRLPNGIDSDIGERGVRLSGGQKQRIQIARAILKNAPILILDEATSSLDAKSENEVQSALENLMQDKLVLVIAHRFSTIQNASKVIVLNNKRIEDIGSPQELAKRPGIYADLLNYQIQGNKKLLEKFDIY